MKLILESDFDFPLLSQAIATLTDGAEIQPGNIHYDEGQGSVIIHMLRREVTGFKNSFLGYARPVYSKNKIGTVLIIKQVENMRVEFDDQLTTECKTCFTLLFGLKFENSHIYLGSVEEKAGRTLYQVFIKIKKIDLEIRDEE